MIPDRDNLLAWYRGTFIPDPGRGFALMNPPSVDDKYVRFSKALDDRLIGGGIDGVATRRRSAHGEYVPRSLAVIPQHRDGWATAAVLDVDHGGPAAVQHVLDVCRAHDLWAFAQLGHSVDAAGKEHDGGHVYIPFAGKQPGTVLCALAMRVQAAARVQGETFPTTGHDLRLPLMLHLRAPGGPRRFPLQMQTGEQVDASDPWCALATLRSHFQWNSVEALTAAFATLPPLPVRQLAKRHTSKVTQHNTHSVIAWYNSTYDLRDLLCACGVRGADHARVVRCPWHDDRSPSLVIFDHPDGHTVCRCFSAASGCPAADVPYLDAFNVYSKGMRVSDAVKHLAEQHNLGERRALNVEHQPTASLPRRATMEEHLVLLATTREHLARELTQAAQQSCTVTVFKATPGLGKTHAAAELANQLWHLDRTVAIVAPSHELAETEWAPRLTRAFVWQSREKLCTCYEPAYLAAWTRLGYALPKCQHDCPYRQQYLARKGRITIYQHNHLHLNHGEILKDADVVIVDESPLPALLEEETRTLAEIRGLLKQCGTDGQNDPATPLLRALDAVGQILTPSRTSFRGQPLIDAVRAALPVPLEDAIAAARTSFLGKEHHPADGDTAPERMVPLFLGRLLRALVHDMQPNTPNTLLAWDGVAWRWFKPHRLLGACLDRVDAPAVLVLDGSADLAIAQRLYAPWPIHVVTIEAPLSPQVTVVQCPVTASTRRIVQDRNSLMSVIRAVMAVCNHLDVTIDGGISYLKAEQQLSETLGGAWLHFGGQRGNNTLKDARTLAIIASPTTPPDAIERKALALWATDPAPIACQWEAVGKGDYRAQDARLEAMNRLHTLEELRQAAHRCRPILSPLPTMVLIFSPWEVASIGFQPALAVTDVPHGNSKDAADVVRKYQARRAELVDVDHFATFQSRLINSAVLPTIENRQSDPTRHALPPPSQPSLECGF